MHVNNEEGDASDATMTINGGTSTVSAAMFAGENSVSVASMKVSKDDVS
jgi:hypothetical protein